MLQYLPLLLALVWMAPLRGKPTRAGGWGAAFGAIANFTLQEKISTWPFHRAADAERASGAGNGRPASNPVDPSPQPAVSVSLRSLEGFTLAVIHRYATAAARNLGEARRSMTTPP